MAIWFCRPSLPEWEVKVNIGTTEKNQSGFLVPNSIDDGSTIGTGWILDGDTIVGIDTENIQESLYDSFNNAGWENGKAFGFTPNDDYRVVEKDKEFEVFVNEKLVAKFFKDRRFS